MLSNEDFFKHSIKTHLFFLRILKEHLYFISTSLPKKNEDLINEAKTLTNHFNNLLNKALYYADGNINITSDAITKYTLEAEKATANLSGMPIDTDLTTYEMSLINRSPSNLDNTSLIHNLINLNKETLELTKANIAFKKKILSMVKNCKVFITLYPLQLDHIIREAFYYLNILTQLEDRNNENNYQDIIYTESFWDDIMKEHAEFIRVLLDPSENDLIYKANQFSNLYGDLKKEAQMINNIKMLEQITAKSIQLTNEFKEFKEDGTKGILNCNIKSIIQPLLADHVLREANYYLYLLNKINK